MIVRVSNDLDSCSITACSAALWRGMLEFANNIDNYVLNLTLDGAVSKFMVDECSDLAIVDGIKWSIRHQEQVVLITNVCYSYTMRLY